MNVAVVRPGRWALVVVVAAGAVATGLALRSSGTDRSALPALVDIAASGVTRLGVEAGGHRVGLTRGERGWTADPGTPPRSAGLLAGAERQLFPMLAYRIVVADAADSQYGLANPEAVVRLEAGGGPQVAVRIGAASFSGAGFYAGHDGDHGRVYLVPRNTVDLLRSLLTGERASSADPLATRAGEYQAEREETRQDKEIPVYLRQALERGGRVPPPGP